MTKSLLTKKTAAILGVTLAEMTTRLVDRFDCRQCLMANSVHLFEACRNDFSWFYCNACGASGSLAEYKRPIGDGHIAGKTAVARCLRVQQRMKKAIKTLQAYNGSLDTDLGLVTAAHIYSTRQDKWDMAFRDQCIWQQRQLDIHRFIGVAAQSSVETDLARRPYAHKFTPQSLVVPLQDYPGRHTGILYLRYDAGVWKQIVKWFNQSENGFCLLESLFSGNPYGSLHPWLCTDLVLGLQIAADYTKFFGETMPMAIFPFGLEKAQSHKDRLRRLFSQLSLKPIVFGTEPEKNAKLAEMCGLLTTRPVTRDLLINPLPVFLADLRSASTGPVV